MSDRVDSVGYGLTRMFVAGSFSFVVFLFLLPSIEQSQGEARTAQTWIDVHRRLPESEEVQQLARSRAVAVDGEAIRLSELDVWEQPYRLSILDDGSVQILSSGPNETTVATQVDDDDICTNMSTSPMQPFRNKRKWDWIIALTCTIGTWVGVSVLINHCSSTLG